LRKRLFILLSFSLFYNASLLAQCPDREVLWSRLINLKYSKLPPLLQATELLSTLDSVNKCSWRNDSTHIYLLRKIAEIYFWEGDYIKAVQYRQKAIDITTANADRPSVKINSLPGIYYYLSAAYDSLNNITEKMKALDSCATIAMRLNHVDRASLYALTTWVEYYFHIGDYQRCIDYAKKCELLSHEYAASNTGAEKKAGEEFASTSFGWQVNALLKLKKFEQAEAVLEDKIEEYKKAGLRNYMGLVYGQLAQVQESRGDYDKAGFYFNQSLKCYQEDKDYFNCKQVLKDIGYNIYFKHLGDGKKALDYYRKALRYTDNGRYSKMANDFESLSIFTNIGALYIQQGLYDSAFKYLQLSFDQVKPGSTEENILHSTPQEMMRFKRNYYLTSLLIHKGDAFRKRYEKKNQQADIQKAIGIYKVADQLLDRIKKEQLELESKLFWRRDTRQLYENAIEACYLSKNFNDAFYFFEKSRSVLLQDQLAEQRWIDEASIFRQTQIKKRLLQLEREYDTSAINSKQYIQLENQMFSLKRELALVQQQVRSNNPLYFQNYMDTSKITLKEIREKILNDHQALVEMFAGDSSVYSLIVTAHDVHLSKINKNSFDSLTTLFIRYISNSSLQNKYFTDFVNVSSQLYQIIFQNKMLPPGRIIISPDGQYFPFESLVTSKLNQPLNWFLKDHAVSYTYSARFLMNDFSATSSTAGKNFMGVAPVNYPSSFALASLPGSDQSLNKISSYFSNPFRLSALSASRDNFLQQFSKYRVIQLYTHAADSSVNNEPVIYFADSALYLSELINESKPLTRLIILSACETGKGIDYQCEGVFSFNRSFAAMGIPSAITNLWSVDNESTYKLTELFYKYLTDGLPTDVALQKAKLEFIQTSSK
jgi:CHAT domain-containing protein/tetratricopeptide (TPR) repeat protein